MGLEGKVLVVIGASSGIGRGIAEAISEKHPRALVLAARRRALLEEIASSFACETYVHPTDVNDAESISGLFYSVNKKYGRIDAVINSAGIIQKETAVEDLQIELIDNVLNTNLRQVLLVAKYISPIFKNQKRGVYLVLSSQAGKYAFPRETVYCASKAGADHLVRVLDKEWREKPEMREVYAFAVGPGFVDTDEARKQFPDVPESVWKRAPKPLDFGRTVIEYLANPGKKYSEGGSVQHIETVRV